MMLQPQDGMARLVVFSIASFAVGAFLGNVVVGTQSSVVAEEEASRAIT
jgi:hypothetical protein